MAEPSYTLEALDYPDSEGFGDSLVQYPFNRWEN